MFLNSQNIGDFVNYIIQNNYLDAEWSIEYAAPGFYFYTDDTKLNLLAKNFCIGSLAVQTNDDSDALFRLEDI